METPVTNILKRKGEWVITIDENATVYEAIQRMVENNVGAIVVTCQSKPCGIFTERDYLRRIALEGRTSKTTQVKEVMTPDVITIDPSYTVEQCLSIMTQNKCRHLPILRDGYLVGIVSIGDCVKELHSVSELRVEVLTHYISGSYPG